MLLRCGISGRNGLLTDGGYAFDTGPTVLTMPDLIADALGSVGESLQDWLELMPVEPLYRSTYPDGSTLDVHADVERHRLGGWAQLHQAANGQQPLVLLVD